MFTDFERVLNLDNVDTMGGEAVLVEDNGLAGVRMRVPIFLAVANGPTIREHVSVSLTLEETTRLRNILNEAIVWAEGVLAG